MNDHTRDAERLRLLTRADIAAHIRVGRWDDEITHMLGVTVQDVAAVRQQVGIRPRAGRKRNVLCSVEEALWAQARHLPDGHAQWLGDLDSYRRPILLHDGRYHLARRLSYTLGHGREPVGRVVDGCEHPACIAHDHLLDEAEHTYLASVLSTLFDTTAPPADSAARGVAPA
jgi:hypothetical protein